jgi:hypothetical protein
MLALVESWRESDKTQIEFARENGLTVSKFRYWVHKSRNSNSSSQLMTSSGFIRLPDKNLIPNQTEDAIRLHYPNGVWLSLPAGTSINVLKNLVDF